MQKVTNYWRENQLRDLVSEAFLRLKFSIVDKEAQDDNTPSANGAEDYSNISEVTDGAEEKFEKYATCEGVWALDGESVILDDITPESGTGYVSDKFCGTDGSFSEGNEPLFTLTFGQNHSQALAGITVVWANAYKEYATDFEIEAFDGASIVKTIHITDNASCKSEVMREISGYNKISIKINKWSKPNRRARIESILLGIEKTYEKESILSFTQRAECDPISSGLPKNEITYSVDNTSGEWNPENHSGMSKYLIQRQEIAVEYGYKLNGAVEWIKGGTYWLSDWDTPSNGISASFTAKGLTDLMSETYTDTLSGTLYSIAQAALTQANLPLTSAGEARWQLDSCLKNITVTNITANYNHTIAETLQLIASAAQCAMYQDRSGILHICRYKPSLSDYPINRFNSYKFGEYSLQKPLKSLVINSGMYSSTPASDGEVVTSDNPFIRSTAAAHDTGVWMKNWLEKRKSLTGQFRADPRLDVLDGVKAENRFASSPLLITSLEYAFNGAFSAAYTGRVYPDMLESSAYPLGTLYLGGIQR